MADNVETIIARDHQIGTPKADVLNGPQVNWRHIDGPMMLWAGCIHWLTYRERLAIFFGLVTVDEVACRRWPTLARRRAMLAEADET